ncbi:hypothetical protein [Methanobrevibacter arboriphilus]|uniref:Uncharacterized protein n=1 Tax=Methanobrevibacter arboriphilus TaxID=39441 RepID=A0ACA8R6F5_METAZ|nr:hypothetical protein [Methanobrevibacter arboriphilus]BBL62640.1 hypothetical protein MarbSA_16800 [Methanobrevibacter arboriphilus]
MDKKLQNKKSFQDLNVELKSLQWKISNDKRGSSILIPFENKLESYYLKITRNYKKINKKYSYNILNENNSQIGSELSYNEFITQEKAILYKKLYETIKFETSIKKAEFDGQLHKIKNMINKNEIQDLLENNYLILKNNVKSLKEKMKKEQNETFRKQKLFPKYNEENAEKFEEILKKDYGGNIIDYIQDKSQYLILNENKNIAFIFLACMVIILGLEGLMIEIHGMADTGKSYIIKRVLKCFIPEEFVYDVNDITEASFLDKGIDNPYYFDRLLISFGDLGDNKQYEKFKPIFNIVKILITENKYIREKKGGKNYEYTIKIILKGKVGALFGTVNTESNESQINSRTLNITPNRNHKNGKIEFKELLMTKGNYKYNQFYKTSKELKLFKQYLKSIICKINKKYEKTEVLNPFLSSISNIAKNSETDTRQQNYLNQMFKVYLVLNYDNCIEIDNENLIFLVPNLEQITKFIELVSNNAGLKPYEKNLIMKLKKEIVPITVENAEKIFKGKCKQYDTEVNPYGYEHREKIDERNKRAIEDLMNENGLNITRKDNNLNNIHFFTSSNVKRIFKNHKSIKDIENMEKVFNNLEERGFLEKLPEKHGKQNVYYLNENEIKQIVENYVISEKDLINAKKHLKQYEINEIQIEEIGKKWDDELKKSQKISKKSQNNT